VALVLFIVEYLVGVLWTISFGSYALIYMIDAIFSHYLKAPPPELPKRAWYWWPLDY
jgi:hypothetical protein